MRGQSHPTLITDVQMAISCRSEKYFLLQERFSYLNSNHLYLVSQIENDHFVKAAFAFQCCTPVDSWGRFYKKIQVLQVSNTSCLFHFCFTIVVQIMVVLNKIKYVKKRKWNHH